MNKDFFNNKIKPEYKKYMIFSMIYFSFIMLICGAVFMYIALFYDKVEPESSRWIGLVVSILSYVICVANPIFTLYLIRNFPKHKRLVFLFIKKFVFVDVEDENNMEI